MISINGDPVVDEVIFEASKYVRYFQLLLDATFCVHEIIEAVVFKVFGRFWRDLAIRKQGRTSYDSMGTDRNLLISYRFCRRVEQEGRIVR